MDAWAESTYPVSERRYTAIEGCLLVLPLSLALWGLLIFAAWRVWEVVR